MSDEIIEDERGVPIFMFDLAEAITEGAVRSLKQDSPVFPLEPALIESLDDRQVLYLLRYQLDETQELPAGAGHEQSLETFTPVYGGKSSSTNGMKARLGKHYPKFFVSS